VKKILISGAKSYIGESFKEYLRQWPNMYKVDVLDTKGLNPKKELFQGFDVIFCVAGIAHIKETIENRHLFYEINRDLVVDIAKAAKEAEVKQFILLSSMSVYGLEEGKIKKDTEPHPINAYGQSKLEADNEIMKIADDNFIFTCLRPPMVYGKNCTGNYQSLRKFALISPIFPDYDNKRSMIYIGNLCKFVKDCIDSCRAGLFFPQNAEYTITSEMVRQIANNHHKKIILTKFFNCFLRIASFRVVKKVFGTLIYEKCDIVNEYSIEESIRQTEI
jgi:UDP-glucose 4-epimerase